MIEIPDTSGCKGGGERTPLERLQTAARVVLIAHRFNLAEPPRSYAQDREVDADIINLIDLDIPRTACGDPLVGRRLGTIRALLLRHVAEDRELSYCQGMSFVAAIFAVASDNQEGAYQRFSAFMRSARGLWLPGFPLLKEATVFFQAAAKQRRWFQHLQSQGIDMGMYLPQALLSMLGLWLPLNTILQCIDIIEQEVLAAMIALTVVILDSVETRLCHQSDFGGILMFIKELKEFAPEPAPLRTGVQEMLPHVKDSIQRSNPLEMPVSFCRRHGSRVVDIDGDDVFLRSTPSGWMGDDRTLRGMPAQRCGDAERCADRCALM